MPSRPEVFRINIFLSVDLRKSRCISSLGPSNISSSFSILFIDSAFSLWSLCSHILLQNLFATLISRCWCIFINYPSTCWKNFVSLIWNVLFCLYCLALSLYLFSLPSFVSNFWFISLSCISCSNPAAFLCLSEHFMFFTCRRFLTCVSKLISPHLEFFSLCSCPPEELRFFHWLISLLRSLIPWCCSLG